MLSASTNAATSASVLAGLDGIAAGGGGVLVCPARPVVTATTPSVSAAAVAGEKNQDTKFYKAKKQGDGGWKGGGTLLPTPHIKIRQNVSEDIPVGLE